MRKLKFIIPVITAIVVIVVTLFVSAFTDKKVESKKKLTSFYYIMTSGNPASHTDRVNPSNYSQLPSSDDCPTGKNNLCQIKAQDNGSGLPVITSGTALYNALNVSSSVPTELPDQVFLKN